MHIYVISRANEERLHTPRLLRAANLRFTLVVDNAEQADRARRLGYRSVVATGCKGIVETRNAITAMAGKKWYIGMDDNIQWFTAVNKSLRGKTSLPTDDGTNWRPRYNKQCTPQEFIEGLKGVQQHCDQVGAVYGGVATMENPFFRAGRWAYRRFVKTKAFVMHGGCGLQFKYSMCHDSYMSALAVAAYGSVVVDNWYFYKTTWYERGGLGGRLDREAKGLLTQMDACVQEFPGLVGVGRGKNTALRFLKVTDKSVERWRKEAGWDKRTI